MSVLKRNIVLLFLVFLTNIVFAQTNLQKKVYPKTYQEAIEEVIKISDDKTKNLLRDCPRFSLRQFAYIIHNNNLIDYKDSDLLTSCAKSIGAKYVHFEDVTNVILAGVWDKLNSDLELIDFEKVEPENYFNSILTIIRKGEDNNRFGYLSSLPYWVYHSGYYRNNNESIRNDKLLKIAKKIVIEKNQNSYLALQYLSQFNPDLEEKTRLVQTYYLNTDNYFSIPTYEYIYDVKSLTKKDDELIGIDYTFKKTSYKEFSLKCFEIIYNKTFNTSNDYETFLNYCNSNYLAKWKFLKTLSTEDYILLLKEPRKLLEILTLTNKYYYKESSNHNLIMGSNSVDDLINLIEIKDKISIKCPYQKRLEEYNDLDDSSYKSINTLKMIAERISIEELFEILNPKSIEFYNKNYKTEDLLDYKYLISFLIASQYERLLNHHEKEIVFKICYYYWENEHVSWPYKYFITDLLIQIDNKKALNIFKENFKSKPTDGSFTRQAILSSIIEYDFQNNSKFIEDWYWIIQGTSFKYNPKEQNLILKLLKKKDSATLNLYTKITNDVRFGK
jgi:hypothetical protein